jgi:predicted porin
MQVTTKQNHGALIIMQKKLLSLAIASALAIPGAAMADVSTSSGANITVYGQMHASWDYVDNDSHGDDNDDNTAVFRNSRLGFKGAEDLGSGLKGIWNIEARIDTGANDVRLRDTFVGLSSDRWGTIKMGRHNTPYKMATEKLDGFADTIADFNNIIGVHMTRAKLDNNEDGDTTDAFDNNVAVMNFNERENQLLMYETPNFNGFSAAIARESFTVDEERMEDAGVAAGGTNTYDDDDEWETLSFMAKYDQGPYFASFAYEEYSGSSRASNGTITNNHGATDEEEVDAWKIGLGYTFGNSKLAFVYEDIDVDDDDDIDNEILAREAYWGMFSHRFGNNIVKLAYGRAEDSDTDTDEIGDGSKDDDDEADNWSIGVEHEFSKRTKVYAIYSHMDNDSDANYGLFQGQNGAWSQDGIANGGGNPDGQGGGFYRSSDDRGEDVSAFSVGIIHTF